MARKAEEPAKPPESVWGVIWTAMGSKWFPWALFVVVFGAVAIVFANGIQTPWFTVKPRGAPSESASGKPVEGKPDGAPETGTKPTYVSEGTDQALFPYTDPQGNLFQGMIAVQVEFSKEVDETVNIRYELGDRDLPPESIHVKGTKAFFVSPVYVEKDTPITAHLRIGKDTVNSRTLTLNPTRNPSCLFVFKYTVQ